MNFYPPLSYSLNFRFLNLILSTQVNYYAKNKSLYLVIMILIKISVCLVLISFATSSIIKICKEISPAHQVYGQQQNLQPNLILLGSNMKFNVGDRVVLYINDPVESVQKTLQTQKQTVKTLLEKRQNATIEKQQSKITKTEASPSGIQTHSQQINITNNNTEKIDDEKQQSLPNTATPLASSNTIQIKLIEQQKQTKNQKKVEMPQVAAQSALTNTIKDHESAPITATKNLENPPLGVVKQKKENIIMSYIQYLLIYKSELISVVQKNTSENAKDENWTIVSEDEKAYRVSMTTQKYIQKQKAYKKNVEQINKHNSDPSKTYTQGLNKFTDIDAQQFTSTYSKLKVPKSIQAMNSIALLTNFPQQKVSNSTNNKVQSMAVTQKDIKQ